MVGRATARRAPAGVVATLLALLLAGCGPGAAQDDGAAEGIVERARALAAEHAGEEPDDPCDLDTNWHYEVLAELSAAVAAVPAEALARIDAEPDDWRGIDPDAFAKWRAAATPDWSDAALRELVAGSEWWPYVDTLEDAWLEFDAGGAVTAHSLADARPLGRWSVSGGRVEVTLDAGGGAVLEPVRSQYFFAEGARWFYVLELRAEPRGDEPPWSDPLVLGPPAGDCGEYNF